MNDQFRAIAPVDYPSTDEIASVLRPSFFDCRSEANFCMARFLSSILQARLPASVEQARGFDTSARARYDALVCDRSLLLFLILNIGTFISKFVQSLARIRFASLRLPIQHSDHRQTLQMEPFHGMQESFHCRHFHFAKIAIQT